jgi:hypothetical protein
MFTFVFQTHANFPEQNYHSLPNLPYKLFLQNKANFQRMLGHAVGQLVEAL